MRSFGGQVREHEIALINLGVDPEDRLEALRGRVNYRDWSDELLNNWPEDVPYPPQPVPWQPSARSAIYKAASGVYGRHFEAVGASNVPRFVNEAVHYTMWLNKRYAIDDKPAEVVWESFLGEGGANRALANIALSILAAPELKEDLDDITRRFEQLYLRLDPLEITDDDGPKDGDLRIREEQLYARSDSGKYWGWHHGGEVPTTALARAMGMEPDAFHTLIERYAIHPTYGADSQQPIAQWTTLRIDNYLIKVMPVDDDPTQVTVASPINELTRDGVNLLEKLLKVYEAGMRHDA